MDSIDGVLRKSEFSTFRVSILEIAHHFVKLKKHSLGKLFLRRGLTVGSLDKKYQALK